MLIIYAHPNKRGHCGYILKTLIKELGDREYGLLDLYEMDYDPVLKDSEHYTSGGKEISKENRDIQEMIKKEDQFIFIYPTWWNNMPAILKGFIDRVFTSHFAFKYEGKRAKALLQGKVISFTSTGAPRIGKLLLHDKSSTVLIKDTLSFCGIKGRAFVIGDSKELNNKQKEKIKDKVKKGLNYLLD